MADRRTPPGADNTRSRQLAAALGAIVAVVAAAGGALAASAFNDVADDHPALAEITAAHQIGVFQGYGDGTFRPGRKLTRGQAELVIHRMLTWQGTDDDGNFEISRADAAVLAMSGLCGLDPDRIPSCAAVVAAASEAEVQAAYDRGYDEGYDDGIDDASTGSTPTEPPTGSTPTGSTPTEPPTGSTPTGSTPTEPPTEPQPRFKARVGTSDWPTSDWPLYSRPYGDSQGVLIEITDVRGQKIAGQTVSWWATGVHEPATSTPPVIGPKTITTNSNGSAVFYLTQPDPDADGDNKTTWTYKIKVGDDVDLEDNLSIGFTVNGDTGTGSIIFDEHDELRLSMKISVNDPTLIVNDTTSTLSIYLDATVDGLNQIGKVGRIFADLDGDDQFGCSDLYTYSVGGKEHRDCRGGPVTSVDYSNDSYGVIDGAFHSSPRTRPAHRSYRLGHAKRFTISRTGSVWVSSYGGDARYWPVSVQSGEVTYRFAADLNRDGDVTDSGEMTSMTFFWPEPDSEP